MNFCSSVCDIGPNLNDLTKGFEGFMASKSKIQEEIEKPNHGFPFDHVIHLSVGNAHGLDQDPITFLRSVLVLMTATNISEHASSYPPDVFKRANKLASYFFGRSLGSYTPNQGLPQTRKAVGEYLFRRDRLRGNYEDIVLTSGIFDGFTDFALALDELKDDEKSNGVMIPNPNVYIYSNYLRKRKICAIQYDLDESDSWKVKLDVIEAAYKKGSKCSSVKAIMVVNPGNPSGRIFRRCELESILDFAEKKKLCILNDEAFESSIMTDKVPYVSMRRIVNERKSKICLITYLGATKGYIAEPGLKSGAYEMLNLSPNMKTAVMKYVGTKMCPASTGQIAIEVLANPPRKGDESYDQYTKEVKKIAKNNAMKSKLLVRELNKIKGFHCAAPIEGAFFAFPKIEMPDLAQKGADSMNLSVDEFYALKLMNQTGVITLPGSLFGQKKGTHHLRINMLESKGNIMKACRLLDQFHRNFTRLYSSKPEQ